MAKNKSAVDRHVAQWIHNRDLISRLPVSHPDWIVTVVFYTAVHAVDAALAYDDVAAWNHDTGFRAIGSNNRLSKVRNLYHAMYNMSRTVRYSANPSEWVPLADIEHRVVRGHLLPLEHSIAKLIGRDLQLPSIDLSHLQR